VGHAIWKREIFFALEGIRTPHRPARKVVTIPTALSRLHSFKMRFNITLPCMSRSPKWSLSFGLHPQPPNLNVDAFFAGFTDFWIMERN